MALTALLVLPCIVVNAGCVKIHGPSVAQNLVKQETASGFFWTGKLADLLAQYESQRDRYPKFSDFSRE